MNDRQSLKELFQKNREKFIFGGLCLIFVIGAIFWYSRDTDNATQNDYSTTESEVDKYNSKTSKAEHVLGKEDYNSDATDLESFYTQADRNVEQENIQKDISTPTIEPLDINEIHKKNLEAEQLELKQQQLELEKERQKLIKQKSVSSRNTTNRNTNTTTNVVVENKQPEEKKIDYKAIFENKGGKKGNTYSGTIRGNQSLKSGQNIRLITSETITTNGITIPINTHIIGVVSFAEYRARVMITNVNLNNQIYPVDLVVYGSDGIEGIPIQIDKSLQRASDEVVDEVSNNTNVNKATKIITSVFSSKAKDPKVTFIDNQKILFVVK